MNDTIKSHLVMFAAATVSAVIIAANINTFIQTGGLYPGGVTGLVILTLRLCETFLGIKLPYAAVNIALNLIPVCIGFRYIGRRFTAYSCLNIVLTGFLTDLFPSFVITYDTLLISIFGGIIMGVAISICLLAETTTGGTDFIAIYLSQRKSIDAWNIILAFNVAQLMIAGFIFGWDKALYSIFFQYAATHVINMLYRRYKKTTLFIVTNDSAAVCSAIYDSCKHGATILKGEGSYEHSERDVVYSVVSADEYRRVIRAVKAADPAAFVNSIKTKEISGLFYQRPTA
ncbi:MAG: YitT family protein [Mailhella sp.]|nr:YitT family protein [Mailhella sp.]